MFRQDGKRHQFCRLRTGLFLILAFSVMCIIMNRTGEYLINYGSVILNNRRGPPYLTYIISSLPQRLNSTMKELKAGLPRFFNINHKLPVPLNDSRILRSGDVHVSSLLLTYVDLWRSFGSRPEAEYRDGDWMFVFEDDVGIVPPHIMKAFYGKIYKKWKYSNPKRWLASK